MTEQDQPASAPPTLPPAGWYPDPDSGQQRYWDGGAWGPVAPPTPPTPAHAAPASQAARSVKGAAIAAAIASVALAIGAFGPWVTLGIIKENGLDSTSDAWALVAGGALGLMGAWISRHGDSGGVGWLLFGGAIGAGASIYHIATFNDRGVEVLGNSPSIGWGLYLGAAAGVLLVLLAFAVRSSNKDNA